MRSRRRAAGRVPSPPAEVSVPIDNLPNASAPPGRPRERPLPDVLPDGPWLGVIDPVFLAGRYPDWAPKTTSHAEAVEAFRRHGFSSLATLAAGFEFEPLYFREINPAWDGQSDTACYRAWLIECITDQPGSSAAHLRRLGLPPDAYPAAFPWVTYARERPRFGAHRWAALDGLFATRDVAFPLTPPSIPLLRAMARGVSGVQDREAIRLYEMARAVAPLPSEDLQHLADAYLREVLWRPAFDLYRMVIADGQANGWTFRNLVISARHLGLCRMIVDDLAHAEAAQRGDPLWDGTVIQAFEGISDDAVAGARVLTSGRRYAAAAERLSEAASALADIMERIDIRPAAARPDPDTVMLIANFDDGESTARRVREKAGLLRLLGVPHAIYSYGESGRVLDALSSCRLAIFFRVPALPQGLRCILAARRLGITTVFESDAQLHGATGAPTLESFHGRVPAADYDSLRIAMILQSIALRLCDHLIAPCDAIARTLPATQSGAAPFIVADSQLPDPAAVAAPGPAPGHMRLFLRTRAITFIDVAPGSFGDGLLRLLREVPCLRLDLSGPVTLDAAFDLLGERVRYGGFVAEPADYWPLLASADIALAVSDGSADADYLAELVWAEAAALGRPTVLFRPASVARPGPESGIGPEPIDDPDAWREELDRLIHDQALRRDAGDAARLAAASRHTKEAACAQLNAVMAHV